MLARLYHPARMNLWQRCAVLRRPGGFFFSQLLARPIFIFLMAGLTFFSRSEQLFTTSQQNVANTLPARTAKASGKRNRAATLDTNASWFNDRAVSRAPSMVFNLFQDLTVTGVLENATSPSPGRTVLRGRVAGERGSYFLFATESNVVSGSVFIPSRGSFKVEYAGNGLHQVIEEDPKLIPPCGVEPTEQGVKAAPNSSEPAENAAAKLSNGGAIFTVVDVLVLYTPQARDGAGGESAINTTIDLAVAEANMTYQNSGVNLVLRLAGTAKVPYEESGNISTDLTRLVNPADGYLDNALPLRAACNADLVCLLVENSDGPSGVALVSANKTNAFSVVQRAWTVGSYVFAHELAHNFGCEHDRPNANTDGAFPYSYGWVFQVNFRTYGTVMAYPGQRIPYFSNPSIDFLGAPTGVASGTNAANNAQTLKLKTSSVSAFSGQTATTKAPDISLASPVNNSTVDVGATVTLTANVSAGSTPVSRVDFYQDDTFIGSSTGPVFSWQLTNVAYGDFSLTARAVDTIGASTLSSPVALHVRYLNDSFALRRSFSGTDVQVGVGTVGATLEPGEPVAFAQEDATVWLTWTAPADGTVLFSLPGHDFPAFTAVYTGNVLTNLQLVSSSPDGLPTAFRVQQGVSYQIAIGGYANISGHATLQWQAFPSAGNDDFADAIQISGSSYHVSANNVAATSEPGEPSHDFYASGHSVWWQWTAPTNGAVSISTSNGQNVDLAVYLGESVSNLTRVVGSNPSLAFSVAAGRTYEIAVDTWNGGYSSFDFDLAFTPGATSPVNDNFAGSIPLVGDNLTVAGSNIGATREPGEPGEPGQYNTGSGQTIWWSWTASATGQLSVDPGRGDAYVVIYTGDTVSALTNMGFGYGKVSISVVAGTTYHILLDSIGNPFEATINLSFVRSILDLSNDYFTNRAVLTGNPALIYQYNGGATKEPGEPNHGNNPGGQSLWYTWTSTFDGNALIKVESTYERFYSLLGIYTGENLTDLQPLAETSSEYQLTVTNGMKLQIAVDGYNGYFGVEGATAHYILSIIGPPANDNFSARQIISGSNIVVKSSNLLATKEPGEPNHGMDAGGSSVWYSWTAPGDGAAKLNLTGFNSSLLGIYTGNSVTALTPIQSTSVMPIDFNVTAGTTYQIAVDTSSGPGPFTLTLAFDSTIVRPVNDDFANRISVAGFTEIFGSNTNATREYGEPYREIVAGTKSVWWEWTSPLTGQVTIDPSKGVIGSVGVFSGTQLTNLVPIIYTLGGPVTFDAVAGQKYEVVVDSYEAWGGIPYGPIDLIIYHTPPSNDDFANRGFLYGTSASGTVSNAGATLEPGEPNHAGAGIGKSVWWSWTAPTSGYVSMISGPGSCLAVYTGNSLSNLTVVASNAVAGQLIFNVVSGETYQIAIDSINSSAVVGSLSIDPIAFDPINDSFSNRAPITGTNFSDFGYNGLASSEPGEPVRGIGKTLWWTWTAPLNGRVRFASSSPYAIAQVFLGDTVSNLTLLAGAYTEVDFTAAAGTVYQLSLDSSIPNGAGNFSFSLTETPEPSNDNFTNAMSMAGLPTSSSGSNLGATLELAEPRFPATNSAATVWWKWAAPNSARTSLKTSGQTADTFQGFSTIFAIYTGDALSNLVLVATGTNGGVFQATAGTTYWIALDSVDGSEGNLTLDLFNPPPNDNFADRQVLTGYSIHTEGTSAGGTMEPGENFHGIDPETASVWFTWTAPASGQLSINYAGDGFYASVSIYTGASLATLTRITGTDFNFSFNVPVTKGVTYQIALAGWYGGGNYTLDLNLDAGNSNDAFANRISLAGTNFTVRANNSSATKQSGEPSPLGESPSHSLWWTYRPPTAGSLRIDFGGVSFTPLIGIYSGSSLAKLKPVTNALDYLKRETVFNVSPKTNYLISIDGYLNAVGSIFLKFDFQPAPLNDQFTNRLALSGDSVTTNSNNRGATEESGEPKHASLGGSHSLWWTWTAPATETVRFGVESNNFPVRFAIYTGSTVKTLKPMASNYVANVLVDEVRFAAQKGSNYQIAVDSDFYDFGSLTLKLNSSPTPLNDDFQQATPLDGPVSLATGSTIGATIQSGESDHAGLPPSHSVWWAWRAGASGTVTVNTSGSSFDTVLAVYTGATVTNLTPVAGNDDADGGGSASATAFDAIAGKTYFVCVDGFAGASGDVHLNIVGTEPQPMQIGGVQKSPDGHLSFQIHGAPSQFFVLQASTNLVNWENVSTNQCVDSVFNFTEPATTGAAAKFYRVAPWP
jgi:hypothetical protein